ncbi:hypothetical protein MBT84_21835 [Streptomyces sp. MBT84]|nr:hypothetical protein [Streptomyces sp. MBT84]
MPAANCAALRRGVPYDHRFTSSLATRSNWGRWVAVATTGWPFGSGSLSWLIKASGGRDLAYGP